MIVSPRGVFECLSWLKARMSDLERDGERLQREVVDAIYDIRCGVGVDFRERLRALV